MGQGLGDRLAGGAEKGEVWAPGRDGASCPLRGPVAGQWRAQEGGWACKDLMQAQGVKASVTEQRGHTGNQSPDGWREGHVSLCGPLPALGGHSRWALERGAGDSERLRPQASCAVKGGGSQATPRLFLTNGRSGSAGLPNAPDAPRPAGESWAPGREPAPACTLWELMEGHPGAFLALQDRPLAPAVR